MSIRLRLLALFTLVIGIGVAGFIALWSLGIPWLGIEGMLAQEIRRATTATEVLADKERDNYERWFAEHRRALSGWGQAPELARLVAAVLRGGGVLPGDSRVVLARRMAVLREVSPGSLSSLYVVGPLGQGVLSSDGSIAAKVDPTHAEVVREALQPGMGESVHLVDGSFGVPAVLVVRQIGELDREDTPTGKVLGLLVAEFSLDVVLSNDAASIVQALGSAGAVVLANAAGEVLLDSSAIASNPRNRFVARQLTVGSETSRVLRVPQGDEVIATFRHLHLGGADTVSLVAIRTTQDAVASIRTSFWRISALVLVLGLLVLALLVFAANRVARTQAQILALNVGLEDRVAARTAELAQANTHLVETLATLERTQTELARNEKLAALGALVAGVSHELNTPLGNSLMAASTMEDHTQTMAQRLQGGIRRSELDRYVADIREGVAILMGSLRRAADLVQSFKQVAVDQTSEQRRRFVLAQTIDEILMTLGPSIRKSGHQVIVASVAPGLCLDSYPGPFGQVLTNLVNNALVHAFGQRPGGVVRITASPCGTQQVQVEVTDNGCGIAPEHLGRVFDPFFTTRLGQGGSGLGLNIVYNLVKDVLGGSVSVQSTVGEGSCFTLTLPLQAPQRAESTSPG